MKKRRTLTLRTQLTAAMVGCVVITVAIALVAALVMMRLQHPIEAARPPLLGDANELDPVLLIVVAVGSALTGALIAVLIARRLVGQLEQIAAAAARLAAGDLSSRAASVAGAAAETLALANTFNTMAASLERLQQLTTQASASIAHELRTPLAILLGRLQGIQEGIFVIDRDGVAGLIRQVEALGRIVDDLSVVSLAAADRLHIAPTSFDLADMLTAMLDDVRPRLAARGLRLENCAAAQEVWADPGRIRQAVLALVENVIKHAAEGGEIEIRTSRNDRQVCIEVLDRGPGIAPAEVDLLFEPFWRRALAHREDAAGSGLGLSVVSSIALAHGGEALARPRHGGGAIFAIHIPVTGPAELPTREKSP